MARYPNILCRVNAIKPEFVVRYVENFPKKPLPANEFYEYVEQRMNGFHSRNYKQAPLQWGLYYEDAGFCYPRFDRNISIDEAKQYIDVWLHNLVVPNPYCSLSQITEPTNLIVLLCEYMKSNPGVRYLHDVASGACKERVKAIDILKNTIAQTNLFKIERGPVRYYKVKVKQDYEKNIAACDNRELLSTLASYFIGVYDSEEELTSIPDEVLGTPLTFEEIKELPNVEKILDFQPEYNIKVDFVRDFDKIYKSYKNMNPKEYFHLFDSEKPILKQDAPLQQIFYGAPGTGKSFAIEEQTEGEDVIRTTFHPDSDYSTFVGAYKPTTIDEPLMTVIGTKAVPVENPDGSHRTERRIVYDFVNQAFLQAYVGAWKKMTDSTQDPKKQFLVIEEINRGNCAQIFGDLFQLLDRNRQGFSEYPIMADADIKKQLKKQFDKLTIDNADAINAMYKDKGDIVGQVLSGDILLLPSNLFIWATMNTSDQSLFPIDSAFKRRWDWKYVPIANAEKYWAIEANGKKYDWWDFLKKINALIGETTNSEDKKLGYFFCKTKTGIIDAETFVGKVIFYLWNDVFKDFEFEGDVFVDTDGETKLTFDKFYKPDASVQASSVEVFLNNLGVMLIGEEPAKDEDAPADEEEPVGRTRYLINGDKFKRKSYFGKEIMMQFIKSHPELTYQEIKDLFPDSLMGDTTYKGLIASTETQLGSYARYYSPETLTSADGVSYKIFKQWTYQNIGNIINFGKEHGFDIEIIEE